MTVKLICHYWLTILVYFSFCSLAISQNYSVTGIVLDQVTEEPLIGATVLSGDKGTVTDFNGEFSLDLEGGNYDLIFSYVGYEQQTISLELNRDQTLKVSLGNAVIQEVLVTADIAVDRKSPFAFSNVATKTIDEELSSQELPMILNSTPGIYATQRGGGDGDARVTIRGFNQNNIAVMIDGVPVNDMENGAVFWSNWFGLDMVTKTMQVQRGLGASKLSIPAVGGTINILSKGIGNKRSFRVKQEVANDNFLRTSLGFTSGRLAKGFGVSGAVSYKKGDGWATGNFTEGWFYFLKLEKAIGDHMLSLSGFGAPQKHGQRSFQMAMATIDTSFARKQGVPSEYIYGSEGPDGNVFLWNQNGINRGRRYNQHVGYHNGDLVNTRVNDYHKPQFTLRHSWQISERSFLSNVAYLSIGKGGGIRNSGSNWGRYLIPESGIYNLDSVYSYNASVNGFTRPEPFSEEYLTITRNEHFWYGLLSTFNQKLNQNLDLSGGIDLRYYKGDHYNEVHDLLGGEKVTFNANDGNFRVDRRNHFPLVGDNVQRNWSGFVQWGGAFGLLEYSNDKISAFFNASGAVLSYAAEDYFIPQNVNLSDTSFNVAYGDTISYNNEKYFLNGPNSENQRIDWISLPTYTFKTGVNYNLNKSFSVFTNLGYFSKPPSLNNVINNSTRSNPNAFQEKEFYENEEVRALEFGGKYRSPKFSSNLNLYYTLWKNRPFRNPISTLSDPTDAESELIALDIPGIDARHMGFEVDFAYKVRKNLQFEGLVSIGDWIWNSEEKAEFFSTVSGSPVVDTFSFDARGVHVGDAAQTQVGAMIRWEPIKYGYVKMRITHFDNHYANFEPEDLKGENAQREVYKTPAYQILDFHCGYTFRLNKSSLRLRGSILNLLDEFYISDATVNNVNTPGINTRDFDAKSTSVHFGAGRRWNISIEYIF